VAVKAAVVVEAILPTINKKPLKPARKVGNKAMAEDANPDAV
jgi:hypothetical protein